MITVTEWEASSVSAARRAELDAMPRVSVTDISPVLAIACGMFIRDQSVSLGDQRELTRMLGLDAPAPPPPACEPSRQVRPDMYRRTRKRRSR